MKFNLKIKGFIQESANVVGKMAAILFQPQCVNWVIIGLDNGYHYLFCIT